MNFLRHSLLMISVAATASLALAAQSPSGPEIFARSEQAYRAFQTLRVEVEWKYETDFGALMADRDIAWIEPKSGRVRIESKQNKAVTVIDGTYLYEYSDAQKGFTKKAPPAGLDRLLTLRVFKYPERFQMTEPRVAGSDKLKISGKEFDCWILEAMSLPGDPTTNAQLGLTPGPMRVWIDKNSGLTLRSELRWNLKTGLAGAVSSVVSSMKVLTIELNQPIPPSTFAFVPPKNAKEVSELSRRP